MLHRSERCLLRKLAIAIGFNVACVCGLTGLLGALPSSGTRVLSGVVETLEGTPLKAIEVHLTNGGSTTTSELGMFSIPLSALLEPGDPIEISLGENWVIASPWQGQSFVPVSPLEILHVRTAHKGDHQLLADQRFVRRMIASAASRLSSKLTSFTDPDESLAEEARSSGFSVDQLKSTIDEWSKNAQTPFEKGLAALYARHYAEATRFIRESVTSDTDQVEKYIALFDAEFQLGRYSEAEAALVAARAIQPSNVLVLLYLEQALEEQAKYSDAEQVSQLALAIDERAFGPEHVQIGSLLNNLALLYDGQGKYAEAEPLYRRALQMDEKLLGPDDRQVATDLNNLAGLYRNEGRYAEAEPLYNRCISIGEKSLGADHQDLATRLSNLAILYNDEGRYAEAEPLYKQALAIDEKRLGPEHPLVATMLNNLGSLYWNENRYAEAEQLEKRALQIWEQTLGPDSPKVAIALDNLATSYDDRGRYSEAEPLYKRSLAIREKALGPEHPDVANCLNNLGLLYDHEKKFAQAEAALRRAIQIDEEKLGSAHADYALRLHNLAVVYTDEGNPEQAVPLYEQSLDINQKALGPDHPAVASDMTALAIALRRLGRNSEADIYEQQAERIRSKRGHKNGRPD